MKATSGRLGAVLPAEGQVVGALTVHENLAQGCSFLRILSKAHTNAYRTAMVDHQFFKQAGDGPMIEAGRLFDCRLDGGIDAHAERNFCAVVVHFFSCLVMPLALY